MLAKTCTSVEMGDSIVIPHKRGGRWDSHTGEGGLLSSELVRTETAGQTLLGYCLYNGELGMLSQCLSKGCSVCWGRTRPAAVSHRGMVFFFFPKHLSRDEKIGSAVFHSPFYYLRMCHITPLEFLST